MPTPAWPNFAAAAGIGGARPVSVPLDFDGERWSLDLDGCAPRPASATRAIFINSPSNPTGWTASARRSSAKFSRFARERGLWIIADEVYSRFVYDGAERAPSFYDLIEDGRPRHLRQHLLQELGDDRLAHRLDLGAAESLGGVIENLIQYSTSGVAAFMQRGAIAALEEGEEFVAHAGGARRGRPRASSARASPARTACASPGPTAPSISSSRSTASPTPAGSG